MSKFQLILMMVFGFFILAAVLVFSLGKVSKSKTIPTLTIWGPFSEYTWGQFINASSFANTKDVVLSYVEKNPATMDSEYTEALALGKGPDILIINQDSFLKNKNKLVAIPYKSISAKDFKTVFIEEGELFLAPDGVYGVPLVVDPLVLYTNRDILSRTGFAEPIHYWDEIYDQASKINAKDKAGNVKTAIMSLGEEKNIPNAKDILSMLMLQAGTPITDYEGDMLASELSNNYGLPALPAEAALDFYTQFSNPTKAFYTWNRSLPDADTFFASGGSAYYIGYSSELSKLKNKNPTLNLAVDIVPQSRVSEKAITYGKIYAFAISRNSPNKSAAASTIFGLVSSENADAFARASVLPPARRDLLVNKPGDDVFRVFYDSALIAHGWLDPDREKTAKLWDTMINDVTAGRASTNEAVSNASNELDILMK